MGSRSNESDNKETTIIILSFKFACDSDLEPKNWLHDQ